MDRLRIAAAWSLVIMCPGCGGPASGGLASSGPAAVQTDRRPVAIAAPPATRPQPPAMPASDPAGPPTPLLPDGVRALDPYGSSDTDPPQLRFAYATRRGVFIEVDATNDDHDFVEGVQPKPIDVIGVSPPIQIVPTRPSQRPAVVPARWEVFDNATKICEGNLVDVQRVAILRNIDGPLSMACQVVAEGIGQPLTPQDVRDHQTLMAGFGSDVVGRIDGCKAPQHVSFLWSRPAKAGASPPQVSSWARDSSGPAGEVLRKTAGSLAWSALAEEVREAYAKDLPGVAIPKRDGVQSRATAVAGEPKWSVWIQTGTTLAIGGVAIGAAEGSLWDVYSAESPPELLMRHRVIHALDLETIASGDFGQGVELIAITRSQCHDHWLMLGERQGALHIRRSATVTCWCSD